MTYTLVLIFYFGLAPPYQIEKFFIDGYRSYAHCEEQMAELRLMDRTEGVQIFGKCVKRYKWEKRKSKLEIK